MARKIKPYKLTGNPALDMVGACINHAERHYRTVKLIELSHKYWKIFVEGVKQYDESYDLSNNEVNFDEVTIRKGNMFQVKPLRYELIENAPTLEETQKN